MSEPKVTVVVVPRERFSIAEVALETLYDQTVVPFKLVYVDGNSPPHLKHYLEMQAKQKGFKLIRTEHFLSPNQSRNLGLAQVDTKYVVFVDNDLLVQSGWLKNLVKCADETGAWVVGPIYLEGNPEDQIIHMAGGKAHFRQREGKRELYQKHVFQRKRLPKILSQLQREPTELIEFHCALVRTEIFQKLGSLDEKLLSSPEHIDLCLSVRQTGGQVYFEPNSIVTYVTPPPFVSTDLSYFFLRWSYAWNQASLEHFRNKWNLDKDDPYIKGNYRWLAGHRRLALKPLQQSISRILPGKIAFKIVSLIDRAINLVTSLYYMMNQKQGISSSQ